MSEISEGISSCEQMNVPVPARTYVVTPSFRWSFRVDSNVTRSKEFMAEPLTDLAELRNAASQGHMRAKMELMIMKVLYWSDKSRFNIWIYLQAQKDICSALEAEELPKYGFRVDRWTREEGGGGVTCIIQVMKLIKMDSVMEVI